MAKIEVVTDSDTYDSLLEILRDIKIAHGATVLNATLNKHPKIKKYLYDRQREALTHIEEQL